MNVDILNLQIQYVAIVRLRCKECINNEDILCAYYGNFTECGNKVNRGQNGWSCDKCKKWLCDKCYESSKSENL